MLHSSRRAIILEPFMFRECVEYVLPDSNTLAVSSKFNSTISLVFLF